MLPYSVGQQLGAAWETQHPPIHLSGNLASIEAKGLLLSAQVDSFPPVQLVFAWARTDDGKSGEIGVSSDSTREALGYAQTGMNAGPNNLQHGLSAPLPALVLGLLTVFGTELHLSLLVDRTRGHQSLDLLAGRKAVELLQGLASALCHLFLTHLLPLSGGTR